MRTSSYTIYVDLPDSRDEMLLVHGYTGAFDRVSRQVASYVRSLEPKRPPKPLYGAWSGETSFEESPVAPEESTVELLRKRGYLTHLDAEQERELFTRLALKLHERASFGPPRYIFMTTYQCNLRCSYCFQDHMRTDSKFKHLLRAMSPSMIDRIFSAMPGLEAAHGVAEGSDLRRNIGFYGGEPLLAEQRPIVEHIMERARSMGSADFWAVTNATEIDAYEDLLGPEGIASLQITLDGPPEKHDSRRIYADGSGSFERIAANIDMALDRQTAVSIRVNVDRNNIDELPRLAEELHSRGFVGRPGFSVYTAPINAVNDKTERQSTMNSWQLDQALAAMQQEDTNMLAIDRPDETIRVRARRLFQGQGGGAGDIPDLRPSFCSAHDKMYIFDPFGDVYACWEKTGDAKIRIARVTEEGEFEFKHKVMNQWRTRSVASNPVCASCRYALHCGGGCAVLALGQRGTMNANFCDGFASRFRASIAEAYGAFARGEQAPDLHEPVCDL